MEHVPEKSAVQDAIEREEALGEYLLERYRARLARFEEEHGMSTETFRERFEEGDLGDDEAFFEWLAVSKGLEHWKEKLEQLRSAG